MEVGCPGRWQKVRCGLQERVVEVLECVDGCGGTRDSNRTSNNQTSSTSDQNKQIAVDS